MSVDSVLDDRYGLWVRVLESWGYELEESSYPVAPNGFLIRARRPETHGDPSIVIDVSETWSEGDDPDGLRITNRGCFCAVASWHAQFPMTGDVGAERLDVDRTKLAELMIHRHPFGEPNDVRERSRWQRPESWLQHIDSIIFEYLVDKQD